MDHKQLLALLAKQIASDPALAQRAARVTNAQELIAFAKVEGASLDIETAQRLLPEFLALDVSDGKLSDDTLDSVTGGAGLFEAWRPDLWEKL